MTAHAAAKSRYVTSMFPSSTRAFRAAALFGFFGVALGAFGAHGLERTFAQFPKTAHWWETAVIYHLLHTAVLLIVACLRPFPAWTWQLFAAGIVIFSGSLYLMALTRVTWLGAITPIGGICFLAGWLRLALWYKGSDDPAQTRE